VTGAASGIGEAVPSGAFLLPRRLVGAADEAGIGEEVTGGREAADVVDLVKEDEGQDLADAGDGEQALVGLRVVYFDGPRKV
jgi:hypothetical protein